MCSQVFKRGRLGCLRPVAADKLAGVSTEQLGKSESTISSIFFSLAFAHNAFQTAFGISMISFDERLRSIPQVTEIRRLNMLETAVHRYKYQSPLVATAPQEPSP